MKKLDIAPMCQWVDFGADLRCIFELAAYRSANPNGKITLKPLFVERGILLLVRLALHMVLQGEDSSNEIHGNFEVPKFGSKSECYTTH